MKQSLCFEPCWARFPMISFFYIHRRLTKNAIEFNLKTFKVSQSKVIFRRYFFLVSKEINNYVSYMYHRTTAPIFPDFKKIMFFKSNLHALLPPKNRLVKLQILHNNLLLLIHKSAFQFLQKNGFGIKL